ncbi:MAG: hypothetical protein IKN98_01100 [Bacteroidales bacterium]|nr:hypothetical protein [Bacteroidales bacterium]
METFEYLTIGSAVLNFLLGGTTVWSIIQWLSEKRLRKIEEQSKETSLETQRFEALTQQIEYQKQLIAEFISNEQARDALDDKQRELIATLKRNSAKIEADKIELERRLTISQAYECHRKECPDRISKNHHQNQEL